MEEGQRGRKRRRRRVTLTAIFIVLGQCILPLGMEEGKIPDDAITASSSYETKSVGPQNARYALRDRIFQRLVIGNGDVEYMSHLLCAVPITVPLVTIIYKKRTRN